MTWTLGVVAGLLATRSSAQHTVAVGITVAATAVSGRYDRAVSETLTSLGVTPGLVVGGPGPAMLRRVVAERASAIGTASCAGDGAGLTVGPPEPVRRLRFWLVRSAEVTSPASGGADPRSGPPGRGRSGEAGGR
jgi:hypothetical protein